jgi:AhpD family alkylhydroperoxidase
MQARLDPFAAAPELMQGMLDLESRVRGSGLEANLVELVKLRASQINGCAFCLDMHATDARRHGETNARLDLLPAWREAPVYSERERAALGWTEALTLVAHTHAPDADYEAVCRHFDERERVALTLLVCAINAWNRIAIGFRRPPALQG